MGKVWVAGITFEVGYEFFIDKWGKNFEILQLDGHGHIS